MAETGLYALGARLYDPELGRFLEPDPLVSDPSDPQAYNRYAYARNNPLSWVDPSGLTPICQEEYSCSSGGASGGGSGSGFGFGFSIGFGSGSGPAYNPSAPLAGGLAEFASNLFNHILPAAQSFPILNAPGASGGGAAGSEGTGGASQSGTESTGQTGPSPAFVAGVATNAAGLAVGGGEVANVQGGQWRASQPLKDGTRPFYDQRFHGNQYTGGRNAVLRRGAAFRLAGRAFFGVGTALSIGDAYQGNISPVQAGQDITFGAIGTFGGPLGLFVSGSYFGSQAAVEFLGLDPAALRAVAPQPPGY